MEPITIRSPTMSQSQGRPQIQPHLGMPEDHNVPDHLDNQSSGSRAAQPTPTLGDAPQRTARFEGTTPRGRTRNVEGDFRAIIRHRILAASDFALDARLG
ncbi:hypothetical protein BDN72DRAFT_40499 [Pluteus cervinus]|uniref:Uncharacterized protein n=1 Tax=Pluteus cervinus TaxID=181527 RepID=A0ACD3BGQ3_9AGAR|nr:hypothetical protein BDN72DRAFT_40499 [Pluteus cervinus]